MRHLIAALTLAGLLSVCAYAESGGKDYHDQDLKGKSFAAATLNDVNFADAMLQGADFKNASLKRATFKGANLQDTNFTYADLTGADLRGSTGEANYQHANLSKAEFEGVTVAPSDNKCRGTSFRKAKITGYVSACDFTGADFRGANLRAAHLNGREVTWKGAVYDDDTAFPDGFDPKAVGMAMAKADGVEKK